MRHALAISRIPEHERRYLEQLDPASDTAASVLPEPPELSEYEEHLSGFYLAERFCVPSEQPLDKQRALDLYERLFCQADAVFFVDALRAMEAEFFAAPKSNEPAPEADAPPESSVAEA